QAIIHEMFVKDTTLSRWRRPDQRDPRLSAAKNSFLEPVISLHPALQLLLPNEGEDNKLAHACPIAIEPIPAGHWCVQLHGAARHCRRKKPPPLHPPRKASRRASSARIVPAAACPGAAV